MPASVAIAGLSAAYPLPGVFPQVSFAQGVASSGQTTYGALLIANRTTAGTATVDTVIYGPDTVTPCQSKTDADALFGVGSEASRMWQRFTKVNPLTPLYVVCPAESVGANATLAITLTTTATGVGTFRVYLDANTFVDTPINTGDTAIAIVAAATLVINGKTDWPFIASNVGTAVLTLTAKQKGLRGNWLRAWSRIFPACGTTTSSTVPAFFTSGTTADSNTTALATILAKRYYFIVSAAEDATQVGALMTQVNAQALATSNIRQTVYFGSSDTLANCTTIAVGLNNPRASVTLLTQSDVPPCELAANSAAIVALGTSSTIPRMNFDNYGLDAVSATTWSMPAPMSGAAPTVSQQVSALNNGISPIAVSARGQTYLVSPITTRSLAGASQPDYQVRDICKVFVSDFYTDDLAAKIGSIMPGKTIANDPIGNAPAPGGPVVTPKVVAAATNKLSRDYFDRGLVQNIDAIIAQTVVIRETAPTSRMSVQVPLQVADVWHSVGIDIRQVA